MFGDCMNRRVTFFTLSFSLLGVALVLLGAVMEVPYTMWETLNNYPYGPPVRWADESFSLQPHTYKYYSIDLVRQNRTIMYTRVEKATNPLVFMINGSLGYGFENSEIIAKLRISSIEPPESPFEYFWTPPELGVWDFIFDNPYDTTINVTVKILCYIYNREWQEEVTRYHPPLDRSFAYAGITIIIAAIAPVAYNLYKTRKKIPKETLQQDEIERMREREEAGKLR